MECNLEEQPTVAGDPARVDRPAASVEVQG